MFCKSITHDFHKHKAEWLDGLPSRELKDHMMMQHIPMDEDYSCPSPHCNAKVKTDSCAPDASIMGDSKRRAEQRKHFGGVPGRVPFTNIPLEDYIIDTLHLVLRVALVTILSINPD
jgi:hypothetical protein